jgi:Protein RETICULATA-related
MLVSCSNDYALVYLLSPAAGTARVANNWLARRLADLPPHVFASGLHTRMQRFACFWWKAIQYGAIGLTMGYVGSSAVNRMTDLREMTDESFVPPTEAPSAVLTGLGWLYFMGISSNVRYNLIAAAEQLMYRRQPGLASKLGSVALRLTNNFAGAYLWVDLADEIGVCQERKSLREEQRKREKREQRPFWMWWKRKKPEPRPWPWRLFQPAC